MTPRTLPPRSAVAAALAVGALLAPVVAGAPAAGVSERARQPQLSFAGESTLAAGLAYQGTVVGGLSSITYDAARDRYYALSDAQPNLGQGPVRFYTLTVDTADGELDAGDVDVVGVTLLTDAAGVPLQAGKVDPEGLTLTPQDTLIMTSEGFSTETTEVAPFVREFSLAGRQLREIDLPGTSTRTSRRPAYGRTSAWRAPRSPRTGGDSSPGSRTPSSRTVPPAP